MTNESNQNLSLGAAIIRALEIENVKCIFGLVGSHILDPYDALLGSSILPVTSKHEANASFMAEAYARLTGDLGVTMVTAGPGSLNGMNGLGQAQYSSTPVLHISGAVPTDAKVHELHATNAANYTEKCAEPLCKATFRPITKQSVLPLLREACSVARSYPQGPVHFEVPLDLFSKETDIAFDYQSSPASALLADVTLSDRLFQVLQSSKQPVFVLDKGCIRQNAQQLCIQIAKKIGAKLVTTRDAIGAVSSDNADYIGVIDTFFAGDAAHSALTQADCIVAIGLEQESYTQLLIQEHAKTEVLEVGTVHIKLAADAIANAEKISSQDVLQVMNELLKTIENVDLMPVSWPTVTRNYESERTKNIQQARDLTLPERLLFSDVILQLEPFIDASCIVPQDVGAHEIWARSILPIYNTTTQLSSSTWASMGFALPAAIAARCTSADKRVYSIIGDGCLLMSMNDLVTVVELGGPTVIIVSNDSEYSLISKVQLDRYQTTSETAINTIDYAKIADAVGMNNLRVTTHQELAQAIEQATKTMEPLLIDVVCEPCSVYPTFGK